MKKLFFVVGIIVIAIGVGSVFLWNAFSLKPKEVTLVIQNESTQSVQGTVIYLDQEVSLPIIVAKSTITQSINLAQLKLDTSKNGQTGRLDLQYRLNNGAQKQLELFGYIEPADNFLYGKTATIIVDESGNATVAWDFE